MGYKVEYVYGERGCGKTTEIIDEVNNEEDIAIYCFNDTIKRIYVKELFLRGFKRSNGTIDRFGKNGNIYLFKRLEQLFCYHPKKILIDNADHLLNNIREFDEMLKLSISTLYPENGLIRFYFRNPCENFSVRTIEKREPK
jgi:hypothetical protein